MVRHLYSTTQGPSITEGEAAGLLHFYIECGAIPAQPCTVIGSGCLWCKYPSQDSHKIGATFMLLMQFQQQLAERVGRNRRPSPLYKRSVPILNIKIYFKPFYFIA